MGSFTSKPACPQAKLLKQAGVPVLLPSDGEYEARQASYWSNSAASIRPVCIARPRNAHEVAAAVKELAGGGGATPETGRGRGGFKFAVRSGGHMQWAGASSSPGGVTIDLGLLAWTRVDEEAGTADIGPGALWRDVYAALDRHSGDGRGNLVVAGGREGNVGVAGLILGGGNTFYTPRRGLACDNVVAFEVVLADGRIVTADAHAHSDLSWALKGGSNNFGIVTNFKMQTFRTQSVWGGLTFYPKQVTPQLAAAVSGFTARMHEDPDSNLLCFFAYTPEFKDVGIAIMSVQVAGAADTAAYSDFRVLPSVMDTCTATTVSELVSDPRYNLPRGYHDIWFTATLKNDARIVAKAAELHEALVEELKQLIPDGDFWTQCLFQPLPKLIGQRSAEAGGNATGIEHQDRDGLLFQAAAMVRHNEQEVLVYPRVRAWLEAVESFAATIEGGKLDWVYLNYADKSQDPLASYGEDNVRRLKEVAARYDPTGVFQEMCTGGFKISHVKMTR